MVLVSCITQEWFNYFAPENPTNEISSLSYKKPIPLSANWCYYIHDVSFIDFKERSIFYDSINGEKTLFLIERTLFDKNSLAAGNGGNIYFQSTGQCVQNKICCTNCSATCFGAHSHVYVSSDEKSKNFVHHVSFSNIKGSDRNQGVLFHAQGLTQIHHVNLSKCIQVHNSMLLISHVNNNISISVSNFRNDTSTQDQGLTCSHSFPNPVTIFMNRCNIIEQICGKGFGIVRFTEGAFIDSCVFKDNIAADKTFFYFDKTVYISNSYINNPEAQSNRNSPLVILNSTSNSNEIKLDLFSTADCEVSKIPKLIILVR